MATQYNNNNSSLESFSFGASASFGSFVSPSIYNTSSRTQMLSAAQASLGTATAVHAAVNDNGASQTISTGLTQPGAPRNMVVTPSGTATVAGTVVINGTDYAGQAISESFAFAAGALASMVGNKAFKSVSSIVQPALGTGVSATYGTGNKLGFGGYLYGNTVLQAFLGGVKESAAPTVTTSLTSLSSNTYTLASALNGSSVAISFELSFDQSLVG